ncbi:TetR/AcrR family transcriptional regulator [Novosphingobium sp. Gsoil 351]|uniref:TetR/AcrR family transcriptional regulator n=1 Tax=Novosphingobium sp. Gsoil 351 TaxID=2675225 RepID=UPI0012B44BCD|nr:TetR/AcrR family transcriptional regulator [Novosphingobium sp. Gsoil 351]QGN55098.1 TetR family transcriptional regulator [Novosphingobium sp. Gsoil 351]
MAESAVPATVAGIPADKSPRTARGRKTQRALLDAAAAEFGEKGFHESSVVSITARAGVALGSFYTYFASKDALFRALVRDMSDRVRDVVAPMLIQPADAITREGAALAAFLGFARDHKEIYRIIDEAEFVVPDEWHRHYERTAQRIVERLREGEMRGEVSGPIDEVHGWALMGMNVFLGLRFGVQDGSRPLDEVAGIANALIRKGLS